jgi:hypothetical protein
MCTWGTYNLPLASSPRWGLWLTLSWWFIVEKGAQPREMCDKGSYGVVWLVHQKIFFLIYLLYQK